MTLDVDVAGLLAASDFLEEHGFRAAAEVLRWRAKVSETYSLVNVYPAAAGAGPRSVRIEQTFVYFELLGDETS